MREICSALSVAVTCGILAKYIDRVRQGVIMRKLPLILPFLLLPSYLAALCSSGTPTSGLYGPGQGASGLAQYVVVMPQPASCYNGDIILFAHGYVAPGSLPGTWLSQLALPDGTTLPGLLNSLGFGFAASSFSKDGLAIVQGIQDTKALTNVIHGLGIPVRKYFVTGASEGGDIATISLEKDPTYSGGVAVCGPIGSFQKQINYFTDVRVLFDYFFPGVLKTGTPGESAINIPPALMANWATVYEPAVLHALSSNPLATFQLLNTAQIPIGLDWSNAGDAITGVLWYNVFATNDAHTTLDGNPYDNIGRIYHGSFNDLRLNVMVARFAADQTATINLGAYETSGRLHDPLVTLHTLADPIVPFWQEALYKAKVDAQGASRELLQIPVLRYGHCNVNGAEAGAALSLMVLKAGL
jgi:hypothetical protein